VNMHDHQNKLKDWNGSALNGRNKIDRQSMFSADY
jgi:hypothetical protein